MPNGMLGLPTIANQTHVHGELGRDPRNTRLHYKETYYF